jgi:hypothetical protein
METEHKPDNRPTPLQFQRIVSIWLAVITLVVSYLMFSLFHVQITARTLLNQAAQNLTTLSKAHIEHTVSISQTITIVTELPLRQEIVVPVNMEVDQVLPLDTSIAFKEEFSVPVDQVLSIDQTFNVPFDIPLTNRTVAVPVPIQADIPIQFNVVVPIDKEMDIQADIPVQFPISENLTVTISHTVPIQMEIPIILDVPIDIAIGDTSFGEYLQNLGESLRQSK